MYERKTLPPVPAGAVRGVGPVVLIRDVRIIVPHIAQVIVVELGDSRGTKAGRHETTGTEIRPDRQKIISKAIQAKVARPVPWVPTPTIRMRYR